MSSGTVSNLNRKVYRHIERWRNQAIEGECCYVYLDGMVLRHSWGGEIKNVSMKKWGLSGVRLIVSDACLGLVEAAAEVFPKADWQRCMVHFYRNVFLHAPRSKVRQVAAMLKAIHAQESRSAAMVKAQDVMAKLKAMKLAAAAELVADGIKETLTYYAFPSQHWIKLKTNNPMERLLREARRRNKVVGAFPDGQSASTARTSLLTPCCA